MTMKKITWIVILGLMIMTWAKMLMGTAGASEKLNAHLQKAEEFEQKKIYVDALLEYQEALKYQKKSLEIEEKILMMYKELHQKNNFIRESHRVLEEYDYPIAVLSQLVEYYIAENEHAEAVEIAKIAYKKHVKDEQYESLLKGLKGFYKEIFIGKDEIVGGMEDIYIGIKDGMYSFVSITGENMGKEEYDYLLPFGNKPEYAPVKKDGEWCYIDKKYYRKLVPDEPVEFLGIYRDGVANYASGGQYTYVDKELKKATDKTWDYAGVFKNGIAAVRKSDKWAIINSAFENITDYVYDDIVLDSFGFCSQGEVYFAKIGEQYHLYDLNGQQLGTEGFDEAKPFIEKEPAAIKKDGKWMYIGVHGDIVLEPEESYEDVQSFSRGMAPVKMGGLWGYMDLDGKIRINPEFEEAQTFSASGLAAVKKFSWRFIQLIE